MKALEHLQCQSGDLAPIVLMPSNPAKADRIGRMLDNAKNVGRYREFVSWTGSYQGTAVSVISTGIGCPSTAIAVEEAIDAGCRILIRVGTCGGAWRDDIPCGSIILPTACVREEGTTVEYVPLSFPAVADLDVITALREQAKQENIPAFCGINRTHDAYYGSSERRKAWSDAFTSVRVSLNRQPILSSEMECSALYMIASLRGARAGAVLAVNAPPEPLTVIEQLTYVPIMKSNEVTAEEAELRSIELVLSALPALSKLSSLSPQ